MCQCTVPCVRRLLMMPAHHRGPVRLWQASAKVEELQPFLWLLWSSKAAIFLSEHNKRRKRPSQGERPKTTSRVTRQTSPPQPTDPHSPPSPRGEQAQSQNLRMRPGQRRQVKNCLSVLYYPTFLRVQALKWHQSLRRGSLITLP